MSQIFDPSRNTVVNNNRRHHGYVTRLLELPLACARFEGIVVFCAEDKRFYECQHIENDTEDYYKWIAVTIGAQRLYFIPVEALTETEIPNEATMSANRRTCCFDAIASAIDEIAVGLYRFGVGVEPLCYRVCNDLKYVDGKKYYIYNNSYDRAEYVRTPDVVPVPGKAYYLPDVQLRYISVFFNEGDSFDPSRSYYESTRPRFIEDPDYSVGAFISHRVFEANGQDYEQLTKKELVTKLNELIEIVNSTGCQLTKATDAGTLFDLCVRLDAIIDELNPFSHPWNNLLNRVSELEQRLSDESIGHATTFDLPIIVQRGNKKFKLDINDGEGNRMVTCVEIPDNANQGG